MPLDLNLILIISVILLATLIPFIFLIFWIKKKKPTPVSALKIEYLEQLVVALGSLENIKSVSREHQRLKVFVHDLKVVSSDQLKNLETPAFLKGKEITLLVKHHTKDVIDYINTLKREGN